MDQCGQPPPVPGSRPRARMGSQEERVGLHLQRVVAWRWGSVLGLQNQKQQVRSWPETYWANLPSLLWVSFPPLYKGKGTVPPHRARARVQQDKGSCRGVPGHSSLSVGVIFRRTGGLSSHVPYPWAEQGESEKTLLPPADTEPWAGDKAIEADSESPSGDVDSWLCPRSSTSPSPSFG